MADDASYIYLRVRLLYPRTRTRNPNNVMELMSYAMTLGGQASAAGHCQGGASEPRGGRTGARTGVSTVWVSGTQARNTVGAGETHSRARLPKAITGRSSPTDLPSVGVRVASRAAREIRHQSVKSRGSVRRPSVEWSSMADAVRVGSRRYRNGREDTSSFWGGSTERLGLGGTYMVITPELLCTARAVFCIIHHVHDA